jgi:hypothetical protein
MWPTEFDEMATPLEALAHIGFIGMILDTGCRTWSERNANAG